MKENEEVARVIGGIICGVTLFMIITCLLPGLETALHGVDLMDLIVSVLLGAITSGWITWRLAR